METRGGKNVKLASVVALSLIATACVGHDPLGVYGSRPNQIPPRSPETGGSAMGSPSSQATGYAEKKAEVLPEGEWSLAACIDIALRSHPKTRSTYLASLAAASRVGSAKSAYWPTADLGVDLGESGNLKSNPPQSDPTFGFTGRFTVRYLIFDASRGARVESAEASLEAADLRHHATLLDLALEVQQAFFQAQGALWYQAVVEDLVKQADSQYRLAAARNEVGLARKYDVVIAQAKLAEVVALRASAASQVHQAQGSLAKAMGLDARQTPRLAAVSETDPGLPPEDVDRLMALAVENRPELGEARAQVREAMAQARIADAGNMPTVSADASLAGGYDTRSKLTIPWSVGVGLTLPLFSGFDTHYSVQAARYDEERARADLASLVNDIQFEVWAAHAVALDAKEQMAALAVVAEASAQSVALAEENYRNGVGTVVEVLDAQSGLASARLNLVRARLDWYLAVARIERAVGKAVAAPSYVPGETR